MKLFKTGENRFQYGDKKLTSIHTQTLCEGCVLKEECYKYHSKLSEQCEELVGRGSLVELKEKIITKNGIENLKKLVQEISKNSYGYAIQELNEYSDKEVSRLIDKWVEENTND